VKIITEHGQDVQMFINDQHGPIIIRQNSWNWSNSTAPAVSRALKTAGLGKVAHPVNRSGFRYHRQNSWTLPCTTHIVDAPR
jgi:hypothetical protein